MKKIEVKIPKEIVNKFSIGESFYSLKLLEGVSHQEREDNFVVFEHEYEKELHTRNILFTAKESKWSDLKTYVYNPYDKHLYVKEGKEVIRIEVREKMVEAIHPYFIHALDMLHTAAEEEGKAEGKHIQEVEEGLKKYTCEFTVMSSKTTKCKCGGTRYRVRTHFGHCGYSEYDMSADYGIFCPNCGCRYMREEIPSNIRNTIEGYYEEREKEIAKYEDKCDKYKRHIEQGD